MKTWFVGSLLVAGMLGCSQSNDTFHMTRARIFAEDAAQSANDAEYVAQSLREDRSEAEKLVAEAGKRNQKIDAGVSKSF